MLSFFNFTGNDVPRRAGHYSMRLLFRHAEPAEDHGEDTSIKFDGLLGGQRLVDNHVAACIEGADQYDAPHFSQRGSKSSNVGGMAFSTMDTWVPIPR